MSDMFKKEELEQEQPNEEAKEAEVESEAEEVEAHDSEEAPESNPLEEKLSVMEKRLKDTQSWGHKSYNAAQELVKEMVESGALSEEDAAKRLEAIKSDDPAFSDDPRMAVSQQIDQELPMVMGILEIDEEAASKRLNAFGKYADQNMWEELLALPANRRTKYVLDKGEELSSLDSFVEENGNSALGIVNKVNELKEENEALKAELDELRSGTSSKERTPKPSGLRGKRPETAPASVPSGSGLASSIFKR